MRRRLVTTAVLATGVTLLLAAPAYAHVSVNPNQATKGSFAKLAISVPNEEASADTVSVDVKFPTDHPIASVSVKPKPGWEISVQKAPLATPLTTDDGQVTEAVSEISWTGGKIGPGQFDEFEVSVGPLPDDVDSLAFPTVQTYSDGTVVSWIQPSVAGQPEPDHPIPELELVAADSSGSSTSSASSSGTPATASGTGTAVSVSASSGESGTTKALAIVAVVLGVLGCGAGGFALSKVRR